MRYCTRQLLPAYLLAPGLGRRGPAVGVCRNSFELSRPSEGARSCATDAHDHGFLRGGDGPAAQSVVPTVRLPEGQGSIHYCAIRIFHPPALKGRGCTIAFALAAPVTCGMTGPLLCLDARLAWPWCGASAGMRWAYDVLGVTGAGIPSSAGLLMVHSHALVRRGYVERNGASSGTCYSCLRSHWCSSNLHAQWDDPVGTRHAVNSAPTLGDRVSSSAI